MKIQINSLAALERLLGGDTQLEIDVRNSVVQAFATKHLKAVANSPEIQHQTNAVREHVEAYARNQITEQVCSMHKDRWTGRYVPGKLLPEVAQAIEAEVSRLVYKQVHETVGDAVARLVADGKLASMVDRVAEEVVSGAVRARVKRQLESALAAVK